MRARLLYRFAAVSSALALAACLGGTGTDTENGLTVVDGSGSPMAQVQVQVRPAKATPDSTGGDPVQGGSSNLVTDSAGSVRFVLKAPGKYLVEGRRNDTVFFVDTLRASSSLQPQVLTARPTVRLSGRIRLLSGFATDTGLVFVRGTGLASAVKADGTYDLGWGPEDARRLTVGVRYSARPASRAYVKIAGREYAGLVLPNTKWAKSGAEPLMLDTDSITLFKKATSSDETCIDDATAAVAPAKSIRGSLQNALDVVRATTIACQNHAGALIETYSVNGAGQPLAKLGDYVLPDSLAWGEATLGDGVTTEFPAAQRAILASCVRAASEGVTYLTSVKANGEVRVEDVKRGLGCIDLEE